MPKELMIGGQAVIEGVMMRTGDAYAVAVRTPKGKIVVKREGFLSATRSKKLYALPFVRGIIMLYETLVLGYRALNYSASQALEEEEGSSGLATTLMLIASVVLALALFKLLPLYLASLFASEKGYVLFNLVDGLAKLFVIASYMFFIGLMPDVRRMFEYHGAEHMAVACYERKLPLTVKNVRKHQKEHPRCGTSFIMTVIILSVIFYLFIPASFGFWGKFWLRIALLPVIAGVSYEVIRFSGKHQSNPLVHALSLPSLWLQALTTRKPADDQIEVAIASLKSVLK